MRSLFAPVLFALAVGWSGAAMATSEPVKPPAGALTEWKEWWGGWVRLEADGNMSCLSPDGVHCYWHKQVTDPKIYGTSKLNPLVCGAPHKEKWGINGYNDNNRAFHKRHWCRSAYATRFAKWVNYSFLGVKKWLAETPAGDVMCHSSNGVFCTEAALGETIPPQVPEVHPLVCGAHYRRIFGKESYDEPGHWCRTPKIDEDFGQRVAKGDSWQEAIGNGWHSAIEPAILVRAHVPEGRTLALRTMAEIKDGAIYRGNLFAETNFGFEFGRQTGFHLGSSEIATHIPSWRTPAASQGHLMAAMTVTPRGNACFFVAPDSGARETPFFAQKNFIGSTVNILDDRGRPILFTRSPGFTFSQWGKSPSEWRADKGEDFVIEKVVALYDRSVPDEKNPGKKRFITYAAQCDGADALSADW
ncbi:hypothetical protein [Roseateles sp.]|uniref:hypothetical protein n=1 Tax=Roseateles sp. TaxID=1971397 RepID=UPI0031DD71B6